MLKEMVLHVNHATKQLKIQQFKNPIKHNVQGSIKAHLDPNALNHKLTKAMRQDPNPDHWTVGSLGWHEKAEGDKFKALLYATFKNWGYEILHG